VTAALDPAVVRATLWRLLALGFTPPREETLAEVEALAEALLARGETAAAGVVEAVRDESVETAGAAYQHLLGGRVRVSPYEGGYELDPIRQGRQMADVAGFYRAFGAGAHGPAAERPDHAGCELEFLAYLELRRLAALGAGDEPGAELVDEVATTFLRDHAGRWLPTFFRELQEVSSERSLYRALAALGSRTVAAELERRGVRCEPLPKPRRRLSVEDDALACAS
jgi:TorA maturation chaperone TorD